MQVYHDDVYRRDRTAPSHWQATASVRPAPQLAADAGVEVAIVGGGYTGLSAALHLARDHGIDCAVLESGPIGWGASGRNGGFVAPGATKLGVEAMDRRYGREATDAYYRSQMDAVRLVRDLIRDEAIDAEIQGDAVYEVAHHPSATAGLKAWADACRRRFGYDASFLPPDAFGAEVHGGTEQHGGARIAGAFGLHPLRFLAGLREAAERHGARLHADSPVVAWTRDGGRHRLATPGGTLAARIVVVATNGYTPEDLDPAFRGRVLPALSNIVVTRPLQAAEIAAVPWRTDCPVSNARALLFYYRLLPDRRFMFGARGGLVGSAEENARMRAWLGRRLAEVFPALAGVTVERFWNGLVCLTGRRTPSVDRLVDDPSVFHAFGYHGNGVNTAPWAGARIAAAIAAGGAARPDVPAPMRGLPPGLGPPAMRRAMLRTAYGWYALSDRLRER